MCVYMCRSTYVRPEVNTDILLNCSLPYFLRQSLSLKLGLTNLASLAGHQPQACFRLCFPSVSISDEHYHLLALYPCAEELDSGSHICVANTSPIGPSPQPRVPSLKILSTCSSQNLTPQVIGDRTFCTTFEKANSDMTFNFQRLL